MHPGLSLPPLLLPTFFSFCSGALFPTFPGVENSRHKEPEVTAFWNPCGGHSQRKWTPGSP